MKKFEVRFKRIGKYRDIVFWAEGEKPEDMAHHIEVSASIALPGKNVTITFEDGEGQLDYGVSGEFTITEMKEEAPLF